MSTLRKRLKLGIQRASFLKQNFLGQLEILSHVVGMANIVALKLSPQILTVFMRLDDIDFVANN